MTSLVYAMVRLYNEREERLNGIVFGDIKSLLLRNIKRLFLMGIACSFLFIFAVVIVVLLAVLTPFTLILTIPLLFAFMVPLALMAPITIKTRKTPPQVANPNRNVFANASPNEISSNK